MLPSFVANWDLLMLLVLRALHALVAGSGQIWLDDVRCSGSESSIENCPHDGWGIQNCDHGEDASVICSSKLRRPGLFKGHFVYC